MGQFLAKLCYLTPPVRVHPSPPVYVAGSGLMNAPPQVLLPAHPLLLGRGLVRYNLQLYPQIVQFHSEPIQQAVVREILGCLAQILKDTSPIHVARNSRWACIGGRLRPFRHTDSSPPTEALGWMKSAQNLKHALARVRGPFHLSKDPPDFLCRVGEPHVLMPIIQQAPKLLAEQVAFDKSAKESGESAVKARGFDRDALVLEEDQECCRKQLGNTLGGHPSVSAVFVCIEQPFCNLDHKFTVADPLQPPTPVVLGHASFPIRITGVRAEHGLFRFQIGRGQDHELVRGYVSPCFGFGNAAF